MDGASAGLRWLRPGSETFRGVFSDLGHVIRRHVRPTACTEYCTAVGRTYTVTYSNVRRGAWRNTVPLQLECDRARFSPLHHAVSAHRGRVETRIARSAHSRMSPCMSPHVYYVSPVSTAGRFHSLLSYTVRWGVDLSTRSSAHAVAAQNYTPASCVSMRIACAVRELAELRRRSPLRLTPHRAVTHIGLK